MMRSVAPSVLVAALVLTGCPRKDGLTEGPRLTDTGWFTDTADLVGEDCRYRLVTTLPEDGTTGWYWRDPLTMYVSTASQERYETYLVDGAGVRLPTEPVWSDDGLSATLTVDGGLNADHTYAWHLRDCLEERVVSFSTSGLGAPLVGGATSVKGNTYVLDLANADWVQPAGLGPVLALYFDTPILLGVENATASTVEFIGAPGAAAAGGGLMQDREASTWDFGDASFLSAPYFEASVAEVVFAFQGTSVPVSSFGLAGTFAADGGSLGGVTLGGLADTRQLGALLGDPDNESALCDYAETLGLSCDPCEDGEVFCMVLSVENVTAQQVEGLELVRR